MLFNDVVQCPTSESRMRFSLQVVPAIHCFTEDGVEFVNGCREDFDAVIFATGYKSNVPSWLKVRMHT